MLLLAVVLFISLVSTLRIEIKVKENKVKQNLMFLAVLCTSINIYAATNHVLPSHRLANSTRDCYVIHSEISGPRTCLLRKIIIRHAPFSFILSQKCVRPHIKKVK